MINNLNILLPEIFLTLSIFSILMIGVFIRKSFNLVFNLSSVIIVITLVMILNLPTQPEKIFLDVLKYIYKLNNTKFVLDKKKFDNVIKTTSFDFMQKLEKKIGFGEATIDEKTGQRIPFFNLGPKNNWKKSLDSKIRYRLEKAFKREMEELGYS